MSRKRKLPKDKQKRAEILFNKYLELHHLNTDRARFDEIMRVFGDGISLRTLKAYKKEFDWGVKLDLYKKDLLVQEGVKSRTKRNARENKGSLSETRELDEHEEAEVFQEEESSDALVRSRQDEGYAPEDREAIVRDICLEYEKGFDLTEICREHGIHHNTFAAWVSANPVLEAVYKDSRIQHEINFQLLYKEKLKNRILKMVEKDYFIEETIFFKIKHRVGANGQMIKQRVETHGAYRKVPNKLDSKSMQMFIDLLRQMEANARRQGELSSDKYHMMDTERLLLELETVDHQIRQEKDRKDEQES